MNSEEQKEFIAALQGKDYIFVKFKKDTTGYNWIQSIHNNR